ncbi:MAG: D-alanyl-D-alanine carboxypeptidase [Clostridia bacterium]|nr:D-alanyl-D-alanine carboxypeptidase [Clostridia bacterium]
MNKIKPNSKKFIYFLLIIAIILPIWQKSSYADQTNNSNTNNNNENLTLYSNSSILIDAKTGQILNEHNAYEKTYPASTTKLMTAILTLENCNLTDSVTITNEAISGIPISYTIAALQPNEVLTVEQLLHVLLIPSANDAANVLACHIAGSIDDFSVMMNAKAKELGCQNTNFVNPSGIHNDEHYSTAYDMALIGKYANTFEKIKEISSKTSYSLPNLPNGTQRNFKTTNTLITPTNKYYYEYAAGLKTGYTDKSKSCIVAKAQKDDIELICVVLGGEKTEDLKSERELDCHTLFEYGFNNYDYYTICSQNNSLDKSNLTDIPTNLQNTDIIFSEDLNLLINIDNYENITSNIDWENDLQLPIYKDTVVGSITYDISGNPYTINLLSGTDILPSEAANSISQFFYILLGILIIIIIITIFINKRKNRFHRKCRSSKEPKYFKHSFY